MHNTEDVDAPLPSISGATADRVVCSVNHYDSRWGGGGDRCIVLRT